MAAFTISRNIFARLNLRLSARWRTYQELVRRLRMVTGPLTIDVGAPVSSTMR